MWIGFNLFIIAMIAIDLVMHRKKEHTIGFNEACGWTLFWIALALGFNVSLYYTHGLQSAIDFFTGYLIEKSLSVDNLFVFLLIFSYFKTPEQLLHKILFYGILGAIAMRAIFIFGGIELVNHFKWLLYLLGIFLIYMGTKIAFKREGEMHPEKNPLVAWCAKWMPVSADYQQDHFFTICEGKRTATPLFLTLLTVEFTDLLFALDSIPAILAITKDPYIVYTSNIFAILGLRALFFALKASLELFHYLHYAIGAILVFIGLKMVISPWVHIPTLLALGFIALSLGLATLLSLLYPKQPDSSR
jgi:tellurite resistance protein TerC